MKFIAFNVIVIITIAININLFAGNKKSIQNNRDIPEKPWLLGAGTDISFYKSEIANGFAINFEPSVTTWLSLNYRFSVNTINNKFFSLHGNPGLVVSPYFFSLALSNDSNRTGFVFLGFISLLLPEGVNLRYVPESNPKISFSVFINPLGVDYARQNTSSDLKLYMSGELGLKANFAITDMIFFSGFAGLRSVYLLNKTGFSAGITAGLIIPRNSEKTGKFVY